MHLLSILWSRGEKKTFALSNPDGYFYLLYLKTCFKFFSLNLLISGGAMMTICYLSNLKGKGVLDVTVDSYFDLVSLLYVLDDPKVYYVSLVLSTFTTVLAYLFLNDFCGEMTRFEFQPDQKIMDQFIQMHTLMIKGINPDISPETAERGIGKVFSLRFGARNILRIQLFRPFDNINKLIKKRK